MTSDAQLPDATTGKYAHLAGTNPFDMEDHDGSANDGAVAAGAAPLSQSQQAQWHDGQHQNDVMNPTHSSDGQDQEHEQAQNSDDGNGPAPTSSWAGSGIAEEELSMSPVDPANWHAEHGAAGHAPPQISPNRPLTPGRRPITPGRVSFGRTRQVYMYRESPKERAQKLAAAAPALARADEIRAENERWEEEEEARRAGGGGDPVPPVEGAIDPASATSAALLSALVAAKSEMLSALEVSPTAGTDEGGGGGMLPPAHLLTASVGSDHHGYERNDAADDGLDGEGGSEEMTAQDTMEYFRQQTEGAEPAEYDAAPRDMSILSDGEDDGDAALDDSAFHDERHHEHDNEHGQADSVRGEPGAAAEAMSMSPPADQSGRMGYHSREV
jgi:hypothetical protein